MYYPTVIVGVNMVLKFILLWTVTGMGLQTTIVKMIWVLLGLLLQNLDVLIIFLMVFVNILLVESVNIFFCISPIKLMHQSFRDETKKLVSVSA